MTPHCPGAGKGRFWCKTMAQYGTVCNICHPHLTMTYMLCHPWHHDGTHVTYDTDMESMTLAWQQWHHTVLELGKDDSGVKQWHNMAQYVIYVIPTSPWRTCYVTHDTTMAPMSPMTQTWNQWHHHGNNGTSMSPMTPACHLWHKQVTYDTNMAPMTPTWHLWHRHVTYNTNMSPMTPQHGTYDTNITLMARTCHLWNQHVTYDTNMSLMTPACHLWHQHVTYDTNMALMTPIWHLWHQHGTYDASMSPMAPACNLWNHDNTHVTYDTDMATMTHCPGAGKGRFWCKTMAQYGTVCNICHPHFIMTYMVCHSWHYDGIYVIYDTDMESTTLSWQQWHHTVLELGKGDFGVTINVKQWHNMAQYVIHVTPTSPWRTWYVTHDTTTAPMSPMTQTWNQWHYHGNNDTTLSWSRERTILV